MNGIRLRAAVAVAGSLVLVLTLAAAASGAPASAAKEGGTLTIGLTAGEPDALDPTLARTFSGREVFLTFCEKLYDLNAKAQIVPQLASKLPTISKDKLTVTIPLRTGIKFNDGTAFNAAAVVKTLQRHLTLKGSARASEISPIDTVTATNASTVSIHLKTPYSPLTAQLADRAGMILSPAQIDKLGDKFAQAPVCVGPFNYDSRVAGDSITVTKSQQYYNKKNVHLDKIVFKVRNDAAAAAAELKAGGLQALDGIDSTQLQGIIKTPTLRVIKQTSLGYQGITLNLGNKNGLLKGYSNTGTPIAANADLRRAFELAIDRKAMNKVVIESTDFVTSLSKADAGTYETFQIGWSGRVDPDGNIYQFVNTQGSQNDSGYSNPRLDLILNNARKAATEQARKVLYRAAQNLILQDRPLIYLYHGVTRAGLSKQLTGVKLYPDTLLRVAFASYK
jgi:peptide/nickel transport system substrate-binding protein